MKKSPTQSRREVKLPDNFVNFYWVLVMNNGGTPSKPIPPEIARSGTLISATMESRWIVAFTANGDFTEYRVQLRDDTGKTRGPISVLKHEEYSKLDKLIEAANM